MGLVYRLPVRCMSIGLNPVCTQSGSPIVEISYVIKHRSIEIVEHSSNKAYRNLLKPWKASLASAKRAPT